MKRALLVSAAAVAVAGVAFAAFAGSSPPEGQGMGSGGHPRMGHGGAMLGAHVTRYDANNDGSITRAEIDLGLNKDFKAADADRNGKVSSAEFKAFMAARHAEMKAKMGKPAADKADDDDDDAPGDNGHGRHAMMDPVKHLDWNLDGSLSLEEFSAPIHLLAMRLDKDANGTITATDLLGRHGGSMMGGH
jgi:hypothetical protein